MMSPPPTHTPGSGDGGAHFRGAEVVEVDGNTTCAPRGAIGVQPFYPPYTGIVVEAW